MTANRERDLMSHLTMEQREQCLAFAVRELRRVETLPPIPLDLQEQWQEIWEELAAERACSEMHPPAAWSESGARIGHYEIIRPLGSGDWSIIYLARDLLLSRLVGIKLLAKQGRRRSMHSLAEAFATARCMHENIEVIYEVGEQDGRPYIVCEYLEGQTLDEWMREYAAATGEHAPVPPGRAVELMLPVVRALVYAHERGIVHRDLKPGHVMLTRSGTIKVLDFGTAKLLSAPSLDGEERICGTPAYMSPEHWKGVIDHRSDVWAVGIMLFNLVTGRHPCSVRELLRIADVDDPMPGVCQCMPGDGSDIGPLAGIIDRCLFTRLEHRTPSARALLAELEALAPGRP